MFKAVSAKEIRKEFPKVRKELWWGEFWEDGYFVKMVGDNVPVEVIRKYIRFHGGRKKTTGATGFILKSPACKGEIPLSSSSLVV